jgi:hypothetical protein
LSLVVGIVEEYGSLWLLSEEADLGLRMSAQVLNYSPTVSGGMETEEERRETLQT